MKTREQLEKILQSHYEFQCVLLARFIPEHIRDEIDFNLLFEILRDWVFNELIPKVLEEIIPSKINTNYDDSWFPEPEKEAENEWYNNAIFCIKQKAKELWFII